MWPCLKYCEKNLPSECKPVLPCGTSTYDSSRMRHSKKQAPDQPQSGLEVLLSVQTPSEEKAEALRGVGNLAKSTAYSMLSSVAQHRALWA